MAHTLGHWARLFYSVPLSLIGLVYITEPEASVQSLTSFIPGGVSLIYVAGLIWLFCGLAIAFDYHTRWATFGIISLLSLYMIMIHIPAVYTGEYLHIVFLELLRDLSLMGGAFFILVQYPEKKASEQLEKVEKNELTIH